MSALVSIVTIHYNEWESASLTLSSIKPYLSDGCLEWIFVDGGSEVNVEDLELRNEIESYSSRYLSEEDGGIYDAMNKGTALANSDYILYLNAGDLLDGAGFESLVEKLSSSNMSDVYLFDSSEGFVGASYSRKKSRNIDKIWWGMPTHHQAIVFRRASVMRYNYDVSLSIGADYKLLAELYVGDMVFDVVHENLCFFDMGGLSSKNFYKGLIDQELVRREILHINWFKRKIIYFSKVFARMFREHATFVYSRVRYLK